MSLGCFPDFSIGCSYGTVLYTLVALQDRISPHRTSIIFQDDARDTVYSTKNYDKSGTISNEWPFVGSNKQDTVTAVNPVALHGIRMAKLFSPRLRHHVTAGSVS